MKLQYTDTDNPIANFKYTYPIVEQQLIQQAWLDRPSRPNVGGGSKGLNTDDTKNVRETVVDWWKMVS